MPPRKKVAPIPDVEDCQSCKYFIEELDEADPPENFGWCRRNPPNMYLTDDGPGVSLIPTKLHWWCGEYKRKLQS